MSFDKLRQFHLDDMPFTPSQTKILKVMRKPTARTIMTAAEIGRLVGTSAVSAGPALAALRKRGIVVKFVTYTTPLKMVFGWRPGSHGLEQACFMPRKTHWALRERQDSVGAAKRLRINCARAFERRFMKLTYNQQEQALRGNWNV